MASMSSLFHAPLAKSLANLGIRTTGGAKGTTTTVSTLAQLAAAANATGPGIVLVEGAISGAAKVHVSSDKTIIGKSGSCEYLIPLFQFSISKGSSSSTNRHWPDHQWSE